MEDFFDEVPEKIKRGFGKPFYKNGEPKTTKEISIEVCMPVIIGVVIFSVGMVGLAVALCIYT